MAKRFLIPVDRGLSSEPAMALVADAARAAGGTVRLLHVAPVPDMVVNPEGRTVAYADQEMTRVEAEHLDHLKRFEPVFGGVAVDSVVRFGEPVEQIVREAEAFAADVVAVMTTCRNGVKRTLLGSVAEQLLRKAPMMVMLIRPADDGVAS
jgi:nucleotide-binding universal stress UspA family protein